MSFLRRIFEKAIFYLFAKKFVAGERSLDALLKAIELEKDGFGVILNILGEYIQDLNLVEKYKKEYIKLAHDIDKFGLNAHISIKLTQLGLCIDKELCRKNLFEILGACEEHNVILEIDRESPDYGEATRQIINSIPSELRAIVRICVQLNNGGYAEVFENIKNCFSVRMCKGAYSGEHMTTNELRDEFWNSVEKFFSLEPSPHDVSSLARVACATHDLFLLDKISSNFSGNPNLEFQLLLGIENKYARELLKQGNAVSLYVPYGDQWFSYGKRRINSIFEIYIRNFKYRVFKK